MTLEQEVVHYRNMVRLYKFDYLTGMKQRHDFEHETLHKFTNQQFYLTMLDVTGLHKVNREKGYEAGDSLIRQVANDIKHIDGLWECYRIGGDEFMALTFEHPSLDIANSTSVTVHSNQFKLFSEMVAEVDLQVTEKKSLLKRRRED